MRPRGESANSLGNALIVDDEEAIRYTLTSELREIGYKPTAVPNAQAALAAVEGDSVFELVMLDVRMPGMGGLEALRRLRPLLPTACIIMLTAVVDAQIAAQAFRFGADGYLTKPWSSEELRARIEKARQQRREAGGLQGQAANAPSRAGNVNLTDITVDLIGQQLTAYERLGEQPARQSGKRPRRSWWPWRRKF